MVGLPSDDPTFATRDGSGKHAGFDVEIARILAKGLGMNPETDVTFRWIPQPLRVDAVTARSVDIQVGGLQPAPQMDTAGPFVVTGSGDARAEQFVVMREGDDAMRRELQRILDVAVADGSWKRAYDSTLRPTGVRATPR
jgi:glutamate transport system substrate-binding protein